MQRPYDSLRGTLILIRAVSRRYSFIYATLEAAQRQETMGIDLVAGYVETHGRWEVDPLLEGEGVLLFRFTSLLGINATLGPST